MNTRIRGLVRKKEVFLYVRQWRNPTRLRVPEKDGKRQAGPPSHSFRESSTAGPVAATIPHLRINPNYEYTTEAVAGIRCHSLAQHFRMGNDDNGADGAGK